MIIQIITASVLLGYVLIKSELDYKEDKNEKK